MPSPTLDCPGSPVCCHAHSNKREAVGGLTRRSDVMLPPAKECQWPPLVGNVKGQTLPWSCQ